MSFESLAKSGRSRGIQAALISAVFLGLAPIFGKQAILVGFSWLAVVAFRTVLAALLVILLMVFSQRQYFYIYPVGLVGCILAGLVNGLGSLLYYSALGRIDASLGQILYSFYPIFVAFWLMLDRQPLSRITVFRLILSILAVFFLLHTDQKSVDLIGFGMMLGAAALYGLHLLINQRVLYDVPPPTVTLYTLVSMSGVTLTAFLVFDRQLPAQGTTWWPIMALALVTFLSRITLFMGVKHLGGLQTALLGLAELFVTILLAHLFLGERLSSQQWIGAGFLGVSLLLVGLEKFHPEKRLTSRWLAWLRPPEQPTDIPW
ncbi:MAG TPA: DMT family transporter [Anaerolineaceae bacterium]|nr:DMT family transporter [Anaerolineaceae bacterium]